ncbi:hypothetical protein [Pararhizobium arenae]|uniref:hypothetical protein n=1 Tax=Pararhizobium arenae TaxID=1856850 RepID=UPI0018E93429|nr:hypothetical protein [Pararhizobium arenae]
MVTDVDKVHVLISSMSFFSRFAMPPRWCEPHRRSMHPVCKVVMKLGSGVPDQAETQYRLMLETRNIASKPLLRDATSGAQPLENSRAA